MRGYHWRKRIWRDTTKGLVRTIWFLVLTIVTQVGGLAYLLSLVLNTKWKARIKGKPLMTFISMYFFFNLVVNPLLAPLLGREPVVSLMGIKPVSFVTILLNRNYVRPALNEVLVSVANSLKEGRTGVEIRYLDANFPFLDGFPLLPHLSHNDGGKIDLSLVYQTPDGKVTNLKKSLSGYGVFEGPKADEFDQTNYCKQKGFYQYDYPKYLTFGRHNTELTFSEQGTKILIKVLLRQKAISKIFLEPHLKARLDLTNLKLRFQGCKAVRHDDHIHAQL